MTSVPRQRRPTAADIARAVGVSRATVGYVLNDTPGQTISDATRDRVLAEARRLGYRPHNAAKALASGRSHIVLLVLPDWPLDHSMRTHLDEASVTLDRAGYSLVTMTPHQDGHAQPLWETLDPDVVMGMLPFPPGVVEQMRAAGVRRIVEGVPLGELDARRDAAAGFAEGPKRQVEHLVARGCTSIAFAGSTDARVAGLVEQRRALAASTARALTGESLAAEADIDAATATRTLERWVAAGVDGVVAYNDDIAALVVGTALRAGIGIPDELAVIGHDDTPIASLFVPSLSSVRIDSAGLGRYVAELALASIDGGAPPAAGPAGEAVVVIRETS